MNNKENKRKKRLLKGIRLTLLHVSFYSILSPLKGNKTQAISPKLPHIANHKCSGSQIWLLSNEISFKSCMIFKSNVSAFV